MSYVLIVMYSVVSFQSFETQSSCEAAKAWVLQVAGRGYIQATCVKK